MMRRIAIFGASGDLTTRYLIPALARLDADDLLAEDLEVLAVDRKPATLDRYLQHVTARMPPDVPERGREWICKRMSYIQADVTNAAEVKEALRRSSGPIVVYLALPSHLLPEVVSALGAVGLPDESLVVIEKPFGIDLESARALNRLLHELFREEQIFRIDHFVHKQMVQNILGLRFANRIFEPVWNCSHIERVDIVWEETLALEGRASYYDRAGALRDMIQNHLLQLLCLVAMEPPATLNERDLRNAKVAVLRAVPSMDDEEIVKNTLRARYTSGVVDGLEVPSYVDEPGIDPARGTETFAEVTLRVRNWRWASTPFRLRTGKALARDHAEVTMYFRPVPHLAFGANAGGSPNVLRMIFDPDRLVLEIDVNGPRDPFELDHIELDVDLHEDGLPAYSRLLLEVLDCDPTLSIRSDEAEESWRIVEPVLAGWRRGVTPLLEYRAGSDGPLT